MNTLPARTITEAQRREKLIRETLGHKYDPRKPLQAQSPHLWSNSSVQYGSHIDSMSRAAEP